MFINVSFTSSAREHWNAPVGK